MTVFKLASAAALVTLLSSPSFAHVTANPGEAQPDSYFRTALRVSHGCSGKATTAIRVQVPDGVVSARPEAKPGWQIEIETRKLDKPVDAGHGRMTDTVVSAITWKGGNLPNAHFDEFGLLLKLPDAPGKDLWLPVVQTCDGGETRWDQIPSAGQSAHSLERPAAMIRIAGEAQNSIMATAKAGDIVIAQPFARATPAKVGGIFMTLKNTGGTADRLVKAASPAAASVELHTHVKDGDAMRMRPVENIPVPANGQTALEPGGYHIMLIDLRQQLKEGASVPLTLTFEKAGTVTLQVPVVKAGAAAPMGGSGGEHKHHH